MSPPLSAAAAVTTAVFPPPRSERMRGADVRLLLPLVLRLRLALPLVLRVALMLTDTDADAEALLGVCSGDRAARRVGDGSTLSSASSKASLLTTATGEAAAPDDVTPRNGALGACEPVTDVSVISVKATLMGGIDAPSNLGPSSRIPKATKAHSVPRWRRKSRRAPQTIVLRVSAPSLLRKRTLSGARYTLVGAACATDESRLATATSQRHAAAPVGGVGWLCSQPCEARRVVFWWAAAAFPRFPNCCGERYSR
jgi:hypothetical protein